MENKLIQQYKSRRNCARLVQRDGAYVVEKTFADAVAFEKERAVYRLLAEAELPCARILETGLQTLVLSALPGVTLVDCLQRQEEQGLPDWRVWEKLVQWLADFRRHTGLVMQDVNLRNFLYDENEDVLYGLDFEECSAGSMSVCAASVAAFVRTYRPEHTPLKQEISAYILQRFSALCALEVKELSRESEHREQMILQRRKTK